MKDKSMEDIYYTPKQAALKIGVSPITIYAWIKTGAIKAQRKGKRLLFIPQGEVLKVERGGR
jgi:excisionase family DNA binding protein